MCSVYPSSQQLPEVPHVSPNMELHTSPYSNQTHNSYSSGSPNSTSPGNTVEISATKEYLDIGNMPSVIPVTGYQPYTYNYQNIFTQQLFPNHMKLEGAEKQYTIGGYDENLTIPYNLHLPDQQNMYTEMNAPGAVPQYQYQHYPGYLPTNNPHFNNQQLPTSTTVQHPADSSTDMYSSLQPDNKPYSFPPVLVKGGGKIVQQKKKRRTEFSAADLKVLEAQFAISDFARGTRRDNIAKQLNVRPRSVTIWFQNKRAKLRAQSQQLNMLKKAAETGMIQETEKIPDFR